MHATRSRKIQRSKIRPGRICPKAETRGMIFTTVIVIVTIGVLFVFGYALAQEVYKWDTCVLDHTPPEWCI